MMARTPQHTYQVLTKRHDRMHQWVSGPGVGLMMVALKFWNTGLDGLSVPWPLPNVWLGVSVENQRFANERIPVLLQTPAEKRFISAEPLLEAIDIRKWIGYYPVNEREAGERAGSVRGGAERGTVDRLAGSCMAPSETHMGQVEQYDEINSLGEADQSRERHGTISSGSRHDEPQEVPRSGTPAGLHSLQRTDSSWPDDQSRERSEERQLAGQFNVGDTLRAGQAREAGAEGGSIGSGRNEEFHGEIERVGRQGNQAPSGSRRIIEVDRGSLRNIGQDGVEDRQGRTVGLSWCIVGGESGPGARPFDLAWARSIVEQCRAAGVPVFVKQLGANPISAHGSFDIPRIAGISRGPRTDLPDIGFRDRKGGDMMEWPDDLRVREFPA